MQKPGLTVVVGAGASISLGVPSTTELTKIVIATLLSHASPSVGNLGPKLEPLVQALRAYHGSTFSFEHLWDALEAAKALVVGWKSGNAPTTSEAALTIARPDLQGALDYNVLSEALFVLKQTVLSDVTGASKLAAEHRQWADFRTFWLGLAQHFSPTIVTLNYDTLVEQALGWDGGHQGMQPISEEDTWRFAPTCLDVPQTGGRLFHLHGSIQFGSRSHGTDPNRFMYEDSFHELYWHPSPESAQQTMWGMSSPRSQSGRALEGERIVSGLNKADKLLVEPLLSYQTELVNQIRREPRLLVVGYGFGDNHVNAALGRMARIHGARRRTCVIDHIGTVREIGSTERAGLIVMLQRWGETSFGFNGIRCDPWTSANGCAQLHCSGLLASPVSTIIDYLAS